MSAPKMAVMMTASEFEDFVMNFGCPECHTRVLHHARCALGHTWESIVKLSADAGREKGRE